MAEVNFVMKNKLIMRLSALASVLLVCFAVPKNVRIINRQKKRAHTRPIEAVC